MHSVRLLDNYCTAFTIVGHIYRGLLYVYFSSVQDFLLAMYFYEACLKSMGKI